MPRQRRQPKQSPMLSELPQPVQHLLRFPQLWSPAALAMIDSNHRWKLAPHLDLLNRELLELAAGTTDRLLLTMPPRHGKCLAKGTPVMMADGTWKYIEDICRSDMVQAIDFEYNTTVQTVVATQFNGVKPVLKLTLFSGRELTCTDNHPVLTVHGWKEAGAIKAGDSIAALRQFGIPNGEPLPWGFASLMGYLTGDGSFGKGEPILTSAGPEVVAHLGEIAEKHNHKLTRDGKYGYHVRRKCQRAEFGPSMKARLREFMPAAKSADKRVPPCIFAAGRADLVDYLAAYFNCDGTVTTCREGVAEFYSVSADLLRDVQRLLSRLGVYSVLRPKTGKYKGEVHRSWRLGVSGGDICRFASQVPVIGDKGRKLRLLAETIAGSGRRHFPQYDSIPAGWKSLLKKTVSWHRLHSGIRVDKQYTRGTARQIVAKIAEIEDNDDLRRVCNQAIIWERVERIESDGDAPTYDIEVEGTHNFIADGVVVHNSECASKYFPAWYLQVYPDRRVILASYEADFASSWGRKARDVFERNGPRIGLKVRDDSSAANRWGIADREGGMMTAGVGGPITGKGSDLLIIDDPVKNSEEALSATYREKSWDWYTSTAFTRLEPAGKVLLIQTRWHEDDLAGRILQHERAKWRVFNLPALAEANDPMGRVPGAALWPDRFDANQLEQIKQTLGERWFTSLYQQRPVPLAGGMFKRDCLNIVGAAPVDIVKRFRAWDKAGTDDGGDYTVGVLMSATKEGRYYVEDVVRGRWSSHERNQVMRQTAEMDGTAVKIWIEQEPGSGGKESAEYTTTLLAGFAVEAERATGDKVVRADPFSSQVQAGNVSLVRGEWNRDYIDELTMFPNGKNDDQVDASSLAFNKLAVGRKPLEFKWY